MHSSVKFHSRSSGLSFQMKILKKIRIRKIIKKDFVTHQKLSKTLHDLSLKTANIIWPMQRPYANAPSSFILRNSKTPLGSSPNFATNSKRK